MSKNRNLANLIASSNNPIADIVASAPGALDTLNELASALGNDASFATTVTNSLASKASTTTLSEFYTKSSPTFTFNYSIDNPNAYSTADSDVFGGAMAISGNIAAISARLEDDAGGTNSGKVYVYNLATNTLLQTISNPNAYSTSTDDYFGNTVALDGNILAVGALGEDDANGTYAGKVYIFNASTGSLLFTIDDPYIAGLSSAYDNFGIGLAVSGNYIFIGVPGKDYDVSTADSGKVYVYSAVSGLLLYSIDNPNAYSTRTGDRFGYVIASYGSYIAVTAFDEDDANNTSSGKVYVFSVGSSSATLLYTLNNPNPVITATADGFGRALAISSTKLVVGSREQSGTDTASGYAFIYDLATGNLLYSIANPNAYATPSNDQFGESLGIAGDLLIIGARGETDATSSSYVGKAYVYNITSGTLVSTINDPNKYGSTHSDTFGNAIAASGSHVLISATTEGAVSGSGVVYKYTSATPITLSATTVTGVSPSEVSDKNNTSTGYLDLPSGTVAQRPVSPTTGMMRFNTTGKWMEYYDGSSWIPLSFGAYLHSWTNTNYGLVADGWKNMNSITCPDFGNNAKLISVSFDGYIVSGSYYWCWRIYNARSGTFLPTIGGWNSKDAYMSSGGGIGYRGNVHAMSTQPARTFDASDCLTGDTLRLELSASSGNGDTVYTNASQTLYVDNVNWWLGSLSGKEMDTWWNA